MDKFKALIMAIAGAMILFFMGKEAMIALSPAQSLYEMDCNQLKEGMRVTGNVDYIYDFYATQTTENKTYGITTSTEKDTKRWYVFPAYGATTEETKLLTLEVSKGEYSVVDNVVEATWAYMNGETDAFGTAVYPINAKVVPLDKDLYPLYYDWYGAEYRDEAEEYLVPYKLMPVTEWSMIGVMAVLGLILFVLGLVFLFKKEKKAALVPIAPETPQAYDNAGMFDNQFDNSADDLFGDRWGGQ